MISSSLTDFLTTNVDITPEEKESLLSRVESVEVKKGTILLRQGEVCSKSYYVQKGLLKYYAIDDAGKEHIIQFAPENWWLSDRDSLYYKVPSQYFIEALEDSTLLTLDDEFMNQLSRTKGFSELNARLLHNHIRQLQNRIKSLLSESAQKRYLDFVELYPDLMLRIPQWMIASYLGITPESLSRVRKELATKHQG